MLAVKLLVIVLLLDVELKPAKFVFLLPTPVTKIIIRHFVRQLVGLVKLLVGSLIFQFLGPLLDLVSLFLDSGEMLLQGIGVVDEPLGLFLRARLVLDLGRLEQVHQVLFMLLVLFLQVLVERVLLGDLVEVLVEFGHEGLADLSLRLMLFLEAVQGEEVRLLVVQLFLDQVAGDLVLEDYLGLHCAHQAGFLFLGSVVL